MLSDAFLSRLDALALAVRGRAAGGAGGLRRSHGLGSSAEFSDFREYIPGDDIRRIDWNALARFDRLFLKLFTEERENAVTVLLDASASMTEKWDHARDAAAALSYLALTGGDQLRVALIGEKGNRMSPRWSGRQAYAAAADFLGRAVPEGGGDVGAGVRHLEGLKKGLSLLITDGYTEDALGETLDYLRYRGQECGVVHVLSGGELDPAFAGAVRLEDAESGEKTDIVADDAVLKDYRNVLTDFLSRVRENCHRRGAAYLLLDAREPFEQHFIPLLARGGFV